MADDNILSREARARVPMKTVFKNGSYRAITVVVTVMGKQLGDFKTLVPGDSLSIPDIPGDYVVVLVS